jgi:hypothetical protein
MDLCEIRYKILTSIFLAQYMYQFWDIVNTVTDIWIP